MPTWPLDAVTEGGEEGNGVLRFGSSGVDLDCWRDDPPFAQLPVLAWPSVAKGGVGPGGGVGGMMGWTVTMRPCSSSSYSEGRSGALTLSSRI